MIEATALKPFGQIALIDPACRIIVRIFVHAIVLLSLIHISRPSLDGRMPSAIMNVTERLWSAMMRRHRSAASSLPYSCLLYTSRCV